MRWSEPSIIKSQLALSKAVDSRGLVRAFQSALVVGTHDDDAVKVVQTLIDYNAEAKLVHFNKLFVVGSLKGARSEITPGIEDKYSVIARHRDRMKALVSRSKHMKQASRCVPFITTRPRARWHRASPMA